jgi:hypothetical protein
MLIDERDIWESSATIDSVAKQFATPIDAAENLATASLGAGAATLVDAHVEALAASVGATSALAQSAGLAGIGSRLSFPNIGPAFDKDMTSLNKVMKACGITSGVGAVTKAASDAMNKTLKQLALGSLDPTATQSELEFACWSFALTHEAAHRQFVRQRNAAHITRQVRPGRPLLLIGRRAVRGRLWYVSEMQRRAFDVDCVFDDEAQWREASPTHESLDMDAVDDRQRRCHDPCADDGARRRPLTMRTMPPIRPGSRHRCWRNSCTTSNTRGPVFLIWYGCGSSSSSGCNSPCGKSAGCCGAATSSAGNSASS